MRAFDELVWTIQDLHNPDMIHNWRTDDCNQTITFEWHELAAHDLSFQLLDDGAVREDFDGEITLYHSISHCRETLAEMMA